MPMRGPLRSAMMLVAIVADQRITDTCASSAFGSGNPSCRAPSFRHSKKQTVKSCGVVSTLTGVTLAPSENRPSVSVPPMSMSTVYGRARVRSVPPTAGAAWAAAVIVSPLDGPLPGSTALGCGATRTGVRIRGVQLVRWSEDQVALTRSALEAARSVLRADYCAVVWRPADGAALEVIATQGISDARARERSGAWFDAALGGQPRASQHHRVEPVRDPNGDVRGALVVDLRSGGVRPGVARALMPVFAAHVALLFEKVEIQARRTGAYEALVQIGMQIQAAEADVDQALQLIVDRSRELLGTDLAWMGLVNEAERTLDIRVAVGARTAPFMRMRLDLGDGVGGQVVANREPVVVPDYARVRPPTPKAVSDAILGEGIGSMLCCPMLTGE